MDARKSAEEIVGILSQCPPRGTHWRHYKGDWYEIIGAAVLESTLEPMVVYRSSPRHEGAVSRAVFVRPLREWLEMVESDGTAVPRYRILMGGCP